MILENKVTQSLQSQESEEYICLLPRKAITHIEKCGVYSLIKELGGKKRSVKWKDFKITDSKDCRLVRSNFQILSGTIAPAQYTYLFLSRQFH